MSDLFSRAMEKSDGIAEAQKACSKIKEKFPYLHDILAGFRGTNGKSDRNPGSVRIFSNGGELKAEVTGKEWVMRGYLLLPEGNLSFENIEAELAAGKIGWSANTERKIPY